jgi:DNA replication protein DnaC
MTDNLLETLFCETHGAFIREPFCGRSCPKCGEEYREKREREDALREARQRLAGADIPRRFRGKTLESFEIKTPAQEKVLAVVRDYVQHFTNYYAAGCCLTFLGGVGTGKSHLGCAAAQAVVNIECVSPNRSIFHTFYSARYVSAAQLVRHVRDTWGTSTATTEVIEDFVEIDLLILDEIGASAGTDSERALLYEVIDLRWQNVRPTIAISNCGLDGLTNVISERGVDRLNDHGGMVCVFDWESYRK